MSLVAQTVANRAEYDAFVDLCLEPRQRDRPSVSDLETRFVSPRLVVKVHGAWRELLTAINTRFRLCCPNEGFAFREMADSCLPHSFLADVVAERKLTSPFLRAVVIGAVVVTSVSGPCLIRALGFQCGGDSSDFRLHCC